MLPMAPLIVGVGQASFSVANSLRTNADAGACLTRTPGDAGNRRTWTFSCWIKRGRLASTAYLLHARSGSGSSASLYFNASDQLVAQMYHAGSGSNYLYLATHAVYRDPSAWYHVVLRVDTTQATAADRIRLYVNGALVSSFAAAIYDSGSADWDTQMNSTDPHAIGKYTGGSGSSDYFDGYLAEVHLIDGTGLAPSSFSEADSNGVWTPKAYAGDHGANGFYLNFGNGAAPGEDQAGGNDWTASNLTGADRCSDTPTNNYPTLSPIDTSATPTLSCANLKSTRVSGSGGAKTRATMAWTSNSSNGLYFEITPTGPIAGLIIGVCDNAETLASHVGASAGGWGLDAASGNKINNGSTPAYGSRAYQNDTIGVAVKNGKIWFAINNVWPASGDPAAGTNAAYTNLPTDGAPLFPAVSPHNGNDACTVNFGQFAFAYAPPAGFKALCTANLPNVAITKPAGYFDVNTRVGTGVAADITGEIFQPDLAWIKNRTDNATNHAWFDSARGAAKHLGCNLDTAEATDANALTAFTGDGFSLGNGSGPANVNTSGRSYVDWLWKAGATPGLDIVTYTGDDTSNRNIGHALGAAPKFAAVKYHGGGAPSSGGWYNWHVGLGSATARLHFNSSNGSVDANSPWGTGNWSATQFMVGNNAVNPCNANGTNYIAYLWADVPGFSKFGSYTGNGSADGPFAWCGFRPRFILFKRIGNPGPWIIRDAARSIHNEVDATLLANTDAAENTADGNAIDILANGFKCRSSDTQLNNADETVIFAAFAEHPFGGANVSPTPAR